jgi:hypothetical protein
LFSTMVRMHLAIGAAIRARQGRRVSLMRVVWCLEATGKRLPVFREEWFYKVCGVPRLPSLAAYAKNRLAPSTIR